MDYHKRLKQGHYSVNIEFSLVLGGDMDSRYAGKPLLRLLECYVLWCIGELKKEDAANLENMTPKLKSLYSKQGKWQDIIASVMELPPNMPELTKEAWEKNRAIAKSAGQELTSEQFAIMFVDTNLV